MKTLVLISNPGLKCIRMPNGVYAIWKGDTFLCRAKTAREAWASLYQKMVEAANPDFWDTVPF